MDGDAGGCVGWVEAAMLGEPMDDEAGADEPVIEGIDSGDFATVQPVAWAIATEQLPMDAMDGVPGKRIQWWTATLQYLTVATGPLPVTTPSILPMSSVQTMSSEPFAVAMQAIRPAADANGTLPAAISATV